MKNPPLNSSPEARELRRLAQEWVSHPDTMNSSDKSAREVEVLNAKLLKAAIAYADAVRAHDWTIRLKKPGETFVVPLLSDQKPRRWRCKRCDRDRFTQKSPHICLGQFRKRKLIWEPLYD